MTMRANWRDDAGCRDSHPDLFSPIGTTGAPLRRMEDAKRLRRVCPAHPRIQCLTWALDTWVADGVRGGTTEDERRVIRSRPGERRPARKTAMTRVRTQQSTENMQYVRGLLHKKQPGFAAALELALALAELDLWSSQMPRATSAARAHDW